jgi:Flp pilus assembly protein TadG
MRQALKSFARRSRRCLDEFAVATSAAAAIEFAYTVPIFIVLSMGILYIGVTFLAKQHLETVAENVAYQVMINSSSTTGLTQAQFQTYVCNNLSGLFDCSKVMVDMQLASGVTSPYPTFTYNAQGRDHAPADVSLADHLAAVRRHVRRHDERQPSHHVGAGVRGGADMTFLAPAMGRLRLRWNGPRRFIADERGIAALEAAFIFPIMVAVLALVFIFGQGFDIKRKVSQSSYQITDLVARNLPGDVMSQATLDGKLSLAAATMQPYSYNQTSNVSIVVSQLQADNTGTTGTVVWSEPYYSGTARVIGSKMALPTGAVAPNAFVLYGEASYLYTPLNIGYTPEAAMLLSDSSWMSPRNRNCIPIYSYNPGAATCG